MSAHITAPSALRPFTLLAALFFTLLAGPAFAQHCGGFEGREFQFVADPDGAAVHFATAWFDGGESIWQAEYKVDHNDLTKGVKMEDKGCKTIPTGLTPDYTSTTLTSTTNYADVHSFERPSDSQVDFAMAFTLEASCSVDCLLTSLDFILVSDIKTDFENPTQSTYELAFNSSFNGLAGDDVEDHTAN